MQCRVSVVEGDAFAAERLLPGARYEVIFLDITPTDLDPLSAPPGFYASLRRLASPDGELFLNVMNTSAGNRTASVVVPQLTARLRSAGWSSVRFMVAQELRKAPHGGSHTARQGETVVTNYLVVAPGWRAGWREQERADAQVAGRVDGGASTPQRVLCEIRSEVTEAARVVQSAVLTSSRAVQLVVALVSAIATSACCFWLLLNHCWAEQASAEHLWQPVELAEVESRT